MKKAYVFSDSMLILCKKAPRHVVLALIINAFLCCLHCFLMQGYGIKTAFYYFITSVCI